MKMSDYENTFAKRGQEYKYAIETYPHVLENEFRIAGQMCSSIDRDSCTIVNIPAACVPLTKYLPSNAHYIEFECNEHFAKLTNITHSSLFSMPIKSNSIDCIISLASLHHTTNEERQLFLKNV